MIARHRPGMIRRNRVSFAISAGVLAALAVPQAAAQVRFDREAIEVDRSSTYIAETLRLSGILGAAHGVRVLCSDGLSDEDEQFWRNYMIELLDLEAPVRGTQLRSSMARAFNNGYSRENRPGRICDQGAVDAEIAYAAEGRKLAESLAAYHFPQPSEDE